MKHLGSRPLRPALDRRIVLLGSSVVALAMAIAVSAEAEDGAPDQVAAAASLLSLSLEELSQLQSRRTAALTEVSEA